MAQRPIVGQGIIIIIIIIKVSRSHSDTPHSVGLLWTSDQPDSETYTSQHTTLTREKHPFPGIPQSQREAADPRLRPRGHWDRLKIQINK